MEKEHFKFKPNVELKEILKAEAIKLNRSLKIVELYKKSLNWY